MPLLPIATLLIALLAAALPAAAPAAEPAARFEALWAAVNENFYDPHFRGTDWAAQRERYRARAAGARNDAEFLAVASEMLGEIRSSHLHVSPPANSRGSSAIGARFVTIGDELVASDVPILSDARRQGLRPGDRLLSPREGLRGEIGSAASVKILACDGRERTLEIRREGVFWPPEHPGFRWFQVRTGPDRRIGYLRIDRFDDGAALLADRAMAELADVDAIVIDLRNNSGGNVSSLRLASYFNGGRAEPVVVLLSRTWLEALGRPLSAADLAAVPRVNHAYTTADVFAAMAAHNGGAAFWIDPNGRQFTGPVFVLVGAETGSAAEGFAWYMREHTRARLIGERTEGALLSSDRIDIGDGWSVTVPVHGLWGPDGTDYGDRPVPPHEVVKPSREDLCAGRDPVLEAALIKGDAHLFGNGLHGGELPQVIHAITEKVSVPFYRPAPTIRASSSSCAAYLLPAFGCWRR